MVRIWIISLRITVVIKVVFCFLPQVITLVIEFVSAFPPRESIIISSSLPNDLREKHRPRRGQRAQVPFLLAVEACMSGRQVACPVRE